MKGILISEICNHDKNYKRSSKITKIICKVIQKLCKLYIIYILKLQNFIFVPPFLRVRVIDPKPPSAVCS